MSIAIHSLKLAFQPAGILKGLPPLGCGYVRSFSHGSSSTSGDAGCGCTTLTRRASFCYGSPRADAVGHAHAHCSLKCTPAFALRLCAGLCRVAIGRVCDAAVSSSPLFSLAFGDAWGVQRRVQPLQRRHRHLLARTSFAAWVDARLTRVPTPLHTSSSRSGVGLCPLLLDRSQRNGSGRCEADVGG